MQPNHPENQLPFSLDLLFRSQPGRILLLCCLGLAAVPVVIMGVISYQTAYHHAQQNIRRNLHMATELKSNQLQMLFERHTSQADGQDRAAAEASLFNAISGMLEMPAELGEDFRIYLVNADQSLLAGMVGIQHHDDIIVSTAQTDLWQQNRADGLYPMPPPVPFVYAGPGGNPVMGTHKQVRLNDADYALIVETEMASAFKPINRLRMIMFTILVLTCSGVLAVSMALARRILGPVSDMSRQLMQATTSIKHDGAALKRDVIKNLALSVNGVIRHVEKIERRYDNQSTFISGLARLHRLLGGDQKIPELCLNSLEFLALTLDLCRADFFIVKNDGSLECAAHYPGHPIDATDQCHYPEDGRAERLASGETTVFLHKDALTGLVVSVPQFEQANLVAFPLLLRKAPKGVLQLEKARVFNRFDCRFSEAAAEIIAVALNAALIRKKEQALLGKARQQAQRLKIREASLEKNTRELQTQTRAFRLSEENLQLKQLELEAANAQMVKNAGELEAHMAILEKQKKDMQKQNVELGKTHLKLAEKARQLEISSRYKTEFMANMSHELRTPLNSILLLSRLLLENKEKNLNSRQFEFARTVHSAGEDLLNLINEILDLAKVESGKMVVELAPVQTRTITNAMLEIFSPLAEQQGVAFGIHVDPDVPEKLLTDRKRIEQIVKNFLSNAFKFTARGSVSLEIAVARKSDIAAGTDHGGDNNCLAISVVDTGIGIPAAKHQMVFEAFQQVDGSTRRKYGGTGLGLSISRELARILGGKITLESDDDQGSRFTLYLPIAPLERNEPAMVRRDRPKGPALQKARGRHTAKETKTSTSTPVPDDRNRLVPGEKCLLIIDANTDTTEPIKAYGHLTGYKVLVAEQFPTGLHFADYYLPDGIFLNLRLPDGNGVRMIPRIKANPKNRHLPVFTLSEREDTFKEAAIHGAAGHLVEPITESGLKSAFQRMGDLGIDANRQILVITPKANHSPPMGQIIGGPKIQTLSANTAAEAQAILEVKTVHAAIIHPAVAADEKQKILTGLQHDPVPVYQYSGLPQGTLSQPGKGSEPMEVNFKAIDTPDQMLLTLSASLHLPPEALDNAHRDRLQAMNDRRNALNGRTVLLADDDMRTVFAVSNVLEDQGAKVLTGKTGKESLDKLDSFPDIDLVLMDVMISDVDGYQAIQEIRNRVRYKALPIIALTAKAMKGDRAKCIQAGADDYLAKPVNLDKLTSMLKIWLDLQRAAPGTPDA